MKRGNCVCAIEAFVLYSVESAGRDVNRCLPYEHGEKVFRKIWRNSMEWRNCVDVLYIEICAIESEVLLRMICSLLSTYTRIAIWTNRIECNKSNDFPLNHIIYKSINLLNLFNFIFNSASCFAISVEKSD